MANALYPNWKANVVQGVSGTSLTGTVKVALVDTGTTAYSPAHTYYANISSAVVGTPVTLSNKSYTNGTFDSDNVIFTAVSGATAEAVVVYVDTGDNNTARLVAFLDTGVTGLPVTPNGGNINLNWDTNGIFTL